LPSILRLRLVEAEDRTMADTASSANGLEYAISGANGTRLDSERTFLGVAALVFVASAAATILWCGSMSAMGGLPIPDGGTMSMAWMPMCGQTWLGAAASFAGMWVVMMAAMMLPSLIPMLQRYRHAISGAGEARLGLLTLLAGAGYFIVWTALGIAIFPLGSILAAAAMQEPALARAVPFAAAAVVLLAGAVQCSQWKIHRLACCRQGPGRGDPLPAGGGAALRYGLRLGIRCSIACANLTVILISLGVMDLHMMTVVAAAITAERLLPASEGIARGIGAIVITTGLFLIARAVALG
jgi:predicted metal-binding membrane protein